MGMDFPTTNTKISRQRDPFLSCGADNMNNHEQFDFQLSYAMQFFRIDNLQRQR